MRRPILALLILLCGVCALAQDSPMVAAAKKTKPKSKKTIVITNETLHAAKASTTAQPLPPVPLPAATSTPQEAPKVSTLPPQPYNPLGVKTELTPAIRRDLPPGSEAEEDPPGYVNPDQVVTIVPEQYVVHPPKKP